MEEEEKKILARDVDTIIASEKLYQNFRELVNAGFTEAQAILYLSHLLGYITVNKKSKQEKRK